MEILREGSMGSEVMLVQTALKRAGYYEGNVDGLFGGMTKSAVVRFQRASELSADGIVGPRTLAMLEPYLLGYVRYRIKRGDTFYALARTYETSVRAIETANPGKDPKRLAIGDTLTIPYGFRVVATDIAYSSQATYYALAGLAARYPFINVSTIGESVMGKKIYCARIGRGGSRVSYNASHHANEWITTPVLLKYLEEYAYAAAFGRSIGGRDAAYLLRVSQLYMVPLVNPDGVDLVTGAIPTSNSYYSAAKELNRGALRFPDDWKANIAGTDLNLNYPAGWEQAKEIKYAQGYTSPGPRDFVGTAPLSAPESRVMYDFTRRNNFGLTLSYHTQGEVIYWKYQDYEPENSAKIGERMSRLSGYALELTPKESSYAGYKDWFIMEYNRPGYTIECGRGMNPLPISQFDRIYDDNERLLTYCLTAVQNP